MIINIDLDIQYHRKQCSELLKNSKKISGFKKHNKFVKVNDLNYFKTWIENITDKKGLDWNFEYFHSGEPVGLHSDDDIVPWDDKTSCEVLQSIIIPLEWNCKQPYTLLYDKINPVSRKMIFRKGEMRYSDNNEIVEYRKHWNFDDEVLKYNPKGTRYYKEYADLKLHEVYPWKINTAILFEASRWHSSSWWLSENDIPDVSTEWKRSIIGFGSRDIPI
tara:strand:- start:35 stop:691 length:657 start_codon:yes stop_codon:yes gene_type:complete